MKKKAYFKHDAFAASSPKLEKLIDNEGLRGYGLYWMLIEMLRCKVNFRYPVSDLGRLARICRTQKKYLVRILKNYELFTIEGNFFYSPGLVRRMEAYLPAGETRQGVAEKTGDCPAGVEGDTDIDSPGGWKKEETEGLFAGFASSRHPEQVGEQPSEQVGEQPGEQVGEQPGEQPGCSEGKHLINNDELLPNARKENKEKEGKEENNSKKEVAVDVPGPDKIRFSPVIGLPSGHRHLAIISAVPPEDTSPRRAYWEFLLDKITASPLAMERLAMHSRLGQLFLGHTQEVVDVFRSHVRLYGRERELLAEHDLMRYFANFLIPESNTWRRLVEILRKKFPEQSLKKGALSAFEEMTDGRRTYFGRYIPAEAPPRPDNSVVWSDKEHRWTR